MLSKDAVLRHKRAHQNRNLLSYLNAGDNNKMLSWLMIQPYNTAYYYIHIITFRLKVERGYGVFRVPQVIVE